MSNRVGVADIVERHKAGWVVEPSVAALSGVLEEVILQPQLRRVYGLNGREAALQNFTSSAVAGSLLNAYQEVLNECPD